MIYMHISDEYDIAEAVKQLISAAIDNHESEHHEELESRIDQLESDVHDLQEVANDRQDRIEYLESILKENGIDFI